MVVYLMIFWICHVLLAQSDDTTRLVKPDAYAIKRFEEVVEAGRAEENLSPQERLISLRARLVIAERKLEDLSSSTNPRASQMKAANARVDYFRKRVSDLEESILKDKRAESSKPKPKRKR